MDDFPNFSGWREHVKLSPNKWESVWVYTRDETFSEWWIVPVPECVFKMCLCWHDQCHQTGTCKKKIIINITKAYLIQIVVTITSELHQKKKHPLHFIWPLFGYYFTHLDLLVGGFNPCEKNISQIGNPPQIGMKIKKYLKPPTSRFSNVPLKQFGVPCSLQKTTIWVAFFCWLWGIIILLVPTRGLRLAYAATVGAYAGTSCRKFAYAAYARVVLLRWCLRGYSPGSFSPPVRWGLLDFMWVVFSSASSSSPLRPPTAMMWAQCPLPDLNRDHVSTVFLAGPQPRSCEFSVPCGPQPRSCVAQCASGDASWRGSVYWKTSWGERAPTWL